MFDQLKQVDTKWYYLANLIWDDVMSHEDAKKYISKRNNKKISWDDTTLEKAIIYVLRDWGLHYAQKFSHPDPDNMSSVYWGCPGSKWSCRWDYLNKTRNTLDSFESFAEFDKFFDTIKESWPMAPISVIEEVGIEKALIEGFANNDQGYLVVNGITKNSDGNRWSDWGSDMQKRGFWPAVNIDDTSSKYCWYNRITDHQDLWRYYEEYKPADEAKVVFSWVAIENGQFTFLDKKVYNGPLMVQCIGPYSDGSYNVKIGDKTYLASGSPLRGDLREYYYSRNTSYYAGYHGGS